MGGVGKNPGKEVVVTLPQWWLVTSTMLHQIFAVLCLILWMEIFCILEDQVFAILLWNTGFSVENVLFDLLELQHLGFGYKRCHHWLPCEMTSEQWLQKFHTDDVHYPGLGIASDRLKWISLATRPIRSPTQIWVVTRHQYGISTVVAEMSFREETSGGITKWQLFSRASWDVKHFNH